MSGLNLTRFLGTTGKVLKESALSVSVLIGFYASFQYADLHPIEVATFGSQVCLHALDLFDAFQDQLSGNTGSRGGLDLIAEISLVCF
jgi:hypothetical protein